MLEILRPLTTKERVWRGLVGLALCVLSIAIAVAIGDPGEPEVVLRNILVIVGLGLFFMWSTGSLLTMSGLAGYTLKEPIRA